MNNTMQFSMNNNESNKSFPTVGLKSLLKNSDLLEILLKPISDEKRESKQTNNININTFNNNIDTSINKNNSNLNSDFIGLELNDLLKTPNNPIASCSTLSDHDYFENKLTNEKPNTQSFGDGYLGSHLWEKNELFQEDKIGLEFLEIEQFLNENGLNDEDLKFLDHLQKEDNGAINNKPTTSNESAEPALNQSFKLNDISQADDLDISITSNRMNIIDEINIDSDSDLEMEHTNKSLLTDKLVIQPMLKKSKKQFVPNELKDDKYWARRRKNNLAAKRSRDTRRFKENQIVITATYLEKENDTLRKQLDDMKKYTKLLQNRLRFYEPNSELLIEKK